MPKNPEQPRRINWDHIIRAIWGAILPQLIGPIREMSAKTADRILPEQVKPIVASLIGAAAQIFEKEFKGVPFEIASDVFEQIAGGIRARVEEKRKPKSEPEELPKLEELEEIAQSKDPEVKRGFLLMFSSPKYHEIIRSFTPEQLDEFINVLINLKKRLEEEKEELRKIGVEIDIKTIWQITRSSLEEISKILGRNTRETAGLLKENLPIIMRKIDEKAKELADEIEKINKQSRKWRLI